MTDTRRVRAYRRVRGSSTSSSRRAASSVRRLGSVLCAACRRSLRRLGPVLCGRCGAPTPGPSNAAANARAAGSRSPSARAAVAYSGRGARRSSRPGRSTGSAALAAVAAELVAERLDAPGGGRHHLYPARSGAAARPRPPSGRAARPGARARAGASPEAPLLVRGRGRVGAPDRPAAGRAPARTSAGAFVAVAEAPRRVLLVDDVYTTGATVSAAATALRHGGRAARRRRHVRADGAPSARAAGVLGYAQSSTGPPPRRSR